MPYTQDQIHDMLKVLDKETHKRLRPRLSAIAYQRKAGNRLMLSLPCCINVDCDVKFKVEVRDVTYHIENSRVCVVVWKDPIVPPQVIVYS